MIEIVRLSIRDAVVQLRREPVAAAFIALTIGVAVAASSAIFTVARGVILRPLPYQDPASLVAIQEFQAARRLEPGAVAFANLPVYRAMPDVEALTAFSYSEAVISGEGDAERVLAGNVDGELFHTLGVAPMVGRSIEASDAGESAAHVVVLSSVLWRRRYGGDRRLIGRSITIDGDAYTVIGVTEEGFEFPRSPAMDRDIALWVPRRTPPPMMMRRGVRDLTAIARLRAGVSRAAFDVELAAAATGLRQSNGPLNNGWQARSIGLRDMVVGRVKPAIELLSVCVGLLLIIACANAAAAMLARTTTRRAAYGIRLALGAGLAQLVGVVVTESIVIGAGAFAVAMPLSAFAQTTLVGIAPVAIPRQDGIVPSGATILFTALVALAAGLLTGLASAFWMRRLQVSRFVQESRTASGSRARTRSLGSFVVTQAALGTVLLGTTLALYGRYERLNSVKPGFETAGVTTATIPMRGMRYRNATARWSLTNQLLERVRALPGVESAAVASLMPLSGGLMSSAYKVRDAATDSSSTAALRAVSPGFFQTLGIPVRLGRPIEATDAVDAPPVAVVNEAFVRQALAGKSAVGSSVTITPPGADEPREFSIVGVVANAKEKDLGSPDSPIIYVSDAQASFPHTVLAFRSRGAPPIEGVRRALRDLDPMLALDDVRPFGEKVRATYALQFFQLSILTMFAASALLLIAIGIYGAVTFVAAADVRATAIRLALGAAPNQIAGAFLGRTGRWSLLGCTIGAIAFVSLQPLFGFAISANDATAIAVGAGLIFVLALLATGQHSLRARTVNALTALNAP